MLGDPSNLRMLLAFGMGALALVLGFVALLTQRTYLDAKTQKPLQVAFPLFGTVRMRTNYPALVFVLLAFVPTTYALRLDRSTDASNVEWTVEGRVTDPGINDWDRNGRLDVYPPQFTKYQVDRNGVFRLSVVLDKSQPLEDVIESITYIHSNGQATIRPQLEKQACEHRDPSCQREGTGTTLRYKPLSLERYPANSR